MKFRPQRATLKEAMLECVELPDNLEALARHLNISVADISVTAYGFDARIGWDTHLITTKDGVLGFTDRAP